MLKIIKNYQLRVRNRGRLFFLALVLLLAGCQQKTELVNVEINENKEIVVATSTSDTPKATSTPPAAKPASATSTSVKQVLSKLELPVLFAQQAPFANWDALHEEACEEASIIMAAKYFGHQPLSEPIMEQEIQKLIKWEEEQGYQIDLTAQEAAETLQNKFGLTARVSREVTVDQIKYELSKGNLIIVPAAGRELGNPNFKQPGPIYHMLVVKGYNENEFITNDPGTRKGNGWKYKYNRLIESVHDWNHELAEGGMTDEEMARGERVMIVVGK